jgi:hypothetical protein
LIWLKLCAEPRLTWKYWPDAWKAPVLNRVLMLPSMALDAASPVVFELAAQPVSLSAVSVAAAEVKTVNSAMDHHWVVDPAVIRTRMY